MSESAEQSEYNDIAIRTAKALSEARGAHARQFEGREIPREAFFPRDRAGLGVALEYERMGNQPVSDDLAARAARLGVEFEHVGLTIGTTLHGIQIAAMNSPEEIAFLRDVLLERKVIFFRDQELTESEHIGFGRHFGELDAFPFGEQGENPYILEIRHGPRSPGTENAWHTDVTWMENPSLGSIAQCIRMPPAGGDTLFSDSHACYLGLPRKLQEELEWIVGINDYRYFLGLPGGGRLPEELVDRIKQEIPFGVHHPLLRTHPETGKTALFFNLGFLRPDALYDVRTGEAVGEKRSYSLVRQIASQHSRPEYTCRFAWQPGSVAFWDNRAVQHYASSDYYPHKRLLRRVTVSGDRPFYEAHRQYAKEGK